MFQPRADSSSCLRNENLKESSSSLFSTFPASIPPSNDEEEDEDHDESGVLSFSSGFGSLHEEEEEEAEDKNTYFSSCSASEEFDSHSPSSSSSDKKFIVEVNVMGFSYISKAQEKKRLKNLLEKYNAYDIRSRTEHSLNKIYRYYFNELWEAVKFTNLGPNDPAVGANPTFKTKNWSRSEITTYSDSVSSFWTDPLQYSEESDEDVVNDAYAPCSNDAAYFRSYNNTSIHQTMLMDNVRTESYYKAIVENPEEFKNKIVLDIGCGSAILSLFCARAGAKRVIAVEKSDMASKAKNIVLKNGFNNIITVIEGQIENVVIPVSEVDIIVSEWMGYCLLYESMLDSVIYARKKYLKKGGKMFPNKASIKICGFCDSTYHKSRINWKNQVIKEQGVDISPLIDLVRSDITIESIYSENICTSSSTIKEFNLEKIINEQETLSVDADFSLINFNSATEIMGLCVYFEVYFEHVKKNTKLSYDEEDRIVLSTAPNVSSAVKCAPLIVKIGSNPIYGGIGYTHWQQTLFLFDRPIKTHENYQNINGKFQLRPLSKTYKRGLDIRIQLMWPNQENKSVLKYFMK